MSKNNIVDKLNNIEQQQVNLDAKIVSFVIVAHSVDKCHFIEMDAFYQKCTKG